MATLHLPEKQPRVSKPKKAKLTPQEQYQAGVEQGALWLLQARERQKDKSTSLAALGAHWRALGPYEIVDEVALLEFCSDILTYLEQAPRPKKIEPLDWSPDASVRFAETARITAATTHSHTGRWVNPNSEARAWVFPQPTPPSVYIGYQQAARHETRGLGFSPKLQGAQRVARALLAAFVWQGRATTLATQLALGCEATLRALAGAGVREEHLQAARAAFADQAQRLAQARELDAGLNGCLPQLLWPVQDERYIALSPMPSLVVSNLISVLSAQARNEEHWMATTANEVGSGNAINISSAAAENGGNLPLLKCLPPRPRLDEASRLVRRAAAGVLLNKLNDDALKRFDVALATKPGGMRRQFMQSAARSHAAIVLAPLFALREALGLDASLAERVPVQVPAHQRAVFDPQAATADRAQCEALYRDVLRAGQQTVLLRHEPGDVENYKRALRRAVDALVAL